MLYMKINISCMMLALCILWTSTGTGAPLVFGSEQLTGRHAERSAIIDGTNGKSLESKAITSGKPAYGDIALAKAKALAPGLYEARFKIEAEPFLTYYSSPFSFHSWLFCQVAVSGQPGFVDRPLWWQDFANRKTPLTVTVPFEVRGKPCDVDLSVSWRDAAKVKGSATAKVYEISVERLDTGCFIRKVTPEKMVYRPGEDASAICELVNVSDNPWKGTLISELVGEMDHLQEIGRSEVTVPAGETIAINRKFKVGEQPFGCEVRATLLKDGKLVHTNSDVFSVAENFWDVALGSLSGGLIHSSGRYGDKTLQVIDENITRMRQRYSNWFEKDFWAPDDWGNLTPEEPEWLSGQGYRWENAKWLKLHIEKAHKEGIKAISYGKGAAGGPSAYQLLRINPEFFMRDNLTGRWGANADLWDLENWNNVDLHIFKKGDVSEKFAGNWHKILPDLSKTEALEHGIHELIASSKEFGFDGVRFDGQFSAVDDVVSTFNMRRTKEKIWAEKPDYLFGLNLCSVHDYPDPFPHEVREGIAGGAHWMNEAIGQWSYDGSKCYTSWRHYARNEHIASERVQSAGGTYHYIYRLDTIDNEARKYYKFVIGILNAAHPCYGDHEFAPGCQNWGKFLTRRGSLFWHPGRKNIEPEKIGIKVENLPSEIEWKLWASSVPLSADRELLVFPFLRFPDTDEIEKTETYPTPVAGARLKLDNPEIKARLKQAWWLTPDKDMTKLSIDKNGVIPLPEIAPFGILVLELKGCPGYQLVNRPRFTEPVTKADLEKSLASGAKKVVVDPLRPELNVINDEKIFTAESEDHSWSMGRIVFDDPDASHGKAAGADKALGKCCTGGYLNDLSPGRYRITARMKLTQPVSGGGQMTVYENVTHPGPTWKDREGSRVNKDFTTSQLGNEYREIEITDKYEHYGIGFCTVFIHFGIPANAPADTRFMVDWVRAERLEEYTDKAIASKSPIEKNSIESVGPRNRILWIRGMYDELYRIDEAVKAAMPNAELDKSYQRNMPKADQLAKYGTIIMPNVPVDKMSLKNRKAYSDWTMAGGHLVILGGDYSLGQGMMRNTFFEDVLPCRLLRNDDVAKMPEHSAVRSMESKTKDRNRIYYVHVTETKPDAEVTAKTGEIPLLMTRKAGKGRCTVFAGTVLGAAKDDHEAFWNGKLWTEIISKTLGK